MAEVLLGDQLQVAGPGLGGQDGIDRGNEAARKHEALDVVHAAPRLFIALVLDGDGLQQGQPIRLEQPLQGGHVGIQILGTDGLDHLDGHQFVELPLQIAVVLHQQRHPILQPGLAHALCGQCVLLGGDGGGGDMAAVVLRGMHGKATPAGADLDHAITRLQSQLLADAIQLASRCAFQ
ncbi:hypothetical protein D3C72_1541060 [compost metagenome]